MKYIMVINGLERKHLIMALENYVDCPLRWEDDGFDLEEFLKKFDYRLIEATDFQLGNRK